MYFMEDFIDYYKEASEDIEVFDYISFGEKYIINTVLKIKNIVYMLDIITILKIVSMDTPLII